MTEFRPDLAGLSQLAAGYDALICDIWGVVHNGLEAHPTAVDALLRFREQGGRVILVTNAARTHGPIAAMLDGMRVPEAAYDAIVTSGDATRDLVRKYEGQAIHRVGPHSDAPIFEGIAVTDASPDEAAAVVVTGLDDPMQTPDDYTDRMKHWLSLKLPMICANPDKVVEVGDRLVYCPGALADIYEEWGGEVGLAGKPYLPIYNRALDLLEKATGKKPDKARLLAVGDSVRTDATGAANLGIDMLFITGSIHAEELDAFGEIDPEAVRRLVAPSGVGLVGFLPRLVW